MTPQTKTGMVHLVGAGPGDLGLVTVRARELIESTDVLVYDYLANPKLLDWAPGECEKIYVGKQSGRHSIAPEKVFRLCV
jgi:uroporphyrinogen III methyltransferase/synthase